MTEMSRHRLEKLQRAEKRLLEARLKYLELSKERGAQKKRSKKKQKTLQLSRKPVTPMNYRSA
jgi:hypothetical protein